MSFETITIQRSYPVINGYVRTPEALEEDREAVTIDVALVEGGSLVRLAAQSGGNGTAGEKHGTQELYQMDAVLVSNGNVDTLSEAVKAIS